MKIAVSNFWGLILFGYGYTVGVNFDLGYFLDLFRVKNPSNM